MSNYNLTDNVEEVFHFQVRDLKFDMRYPRTEEVEKLQEMTNDLKKADQAEDEVKAETLAKEMESYIYQFIQPNGHDTSIKDALKSENVRVLRNFNTMIKTELSIQ